MFATLSHCKSRMSHSGSAARGVHTAYLYLCGGDSVRCADGIFMGGNLWGRSGQICWHIERKVGRWRVVALCHTADPTLLLTEIEQISEDQVQRNLFGHKSGSIFPKPLCSVSVREGGVWEAREGLGNNDNGGIVKGGFVTSRPERFNGVSIRRE